MTLPPAPGTANEGRLTGSGLYADRLRHDLDEHYSARTVGGPKFIMPEGDTLQLTVCTVLHRTLDNRYTPLAQPTAHADSLRLEESLTYDVSQDRGDCSLIFTLRSEADAPIDVRFIVSDAAGIAFDAGHCRLMPGEPTTMRVDYSRLPESAVCAVAIRADGYAPVEHKFRR